MGKFKVKINDVNNIKDLLQITYDLADEQLIQAQHEISKLSNSTKLQDEIMEAKAKYAKAMHDYLSMKDKALGKKIEIAKLLAEICKHNGDINKAVEENSAQNMTFDFSKIREMVNNSRNEKKDEIIEIKK